MAAPARTPGGHARRGQRSTSRMLWFSALYRRAVVVAISLPARKAWPPAVMTPVMARRRLRTDTARSFVDRVPAQSSGAALHQPSRDLKETYELSPLVGARPVASTLPGAASARSPQTDLGRHRRRTGRLAG